MTMLLRAATILLSLTCAVEAGNRAPAPSTYNPTKHLHVRDARDAKRIREALIRYIWKSGRMPSVRPSRVKDVSDAEFHPLKSNKIAKVTQLDHVMHLGLTSRSFLFSTSQLVGCLFVYHSGHAGDPAAIGEIDLLLRALDIGCDVITLRMPLTSGNSQSTVDTPFGPIRMTEHGALALLDTAAFSPIQYFMHPIAASINFALASRRPYRAITMAGHSGGGWATTLYAAIDPRIRVSFPLYGSLPFPLRGGGVFGDWEQIVPALYSIADYLDLYALGTFPNRKQVQMLNANDTCCFGGHGALSYVRILKNRATKWGGEFSLDLEDGGHSHSISARHAEIVLSALTSLTERPPSSRAPNLTPSLSSR